MRNVISCICIAWIELLLSLVAQAQWIQTKGPYGGYVPAITVMGNTVIAGGLVSTDNGSTWTWGVSPPNGGWCYANDDTLLFAGTYNGVFVSRDTAKSWVPTGNISNIVDVNIEVNAVTVIGSHLLAGVNFHGIYVSTDYGTSWAAANAGLTSRSINCFAVSGSKVFAGTSDAGVFISTDSGSSWSATNNGLGGNDISALLAAGGALFAGTPDGEIFLSTNGGVGWTSRSLGIPSVSVNAFASSGNYVFVGTDAGVFSSSDNGSSWDRVNTGLEDTSVISLVVSHGALLAGTSHGVFVSTNYGASWSCTGFPIGVDYLATISGHLFAGSLREGVFASADYGATWEKISLAIPDTQVTALLASSSLLFLSTFGQGIFRSTDYGATWRQVNIGLLDTSVTALVAVGTDIFAATYDGSLYISNNAGNDWKPTSLQDAYVHCTAAGDGILFIGSTNKGVLVTTDQGVDWSSASPTNSAVNALAVDEKDLFAGTTADGVLHSTDDGKTWTDVNNGLPTNFVNTFAVASKYSAIFAGTDRGLFVSTNAGQLWNPVKSDSNGYAIAAGTLLVADTNIYVSTYSGIWRRALSELITVIKERGSNSMTGFGLEQNYPNPFNPSTSITFHIPTKSSVSIEIYDVLGRIVRSLFYGTLPPGTYSREWVAATLPSGVYFCRLSAKPFGEPNTYIQTRKLVLVK
jgi:photosystem II stability/assembly factor-like uncharacterized protein